MFGSVAELDTRGQFGGQEAQRQQTEDAAGETTEEARLNVGRKL